jgi:hypothetical protein
VILGRSNRCAAAPLCVAAVAVLSSGCGAGNLVASCAAPPSLSVVVTVRDSISGSAAADSATGTLVGDTVNDTLLHGDSLTLQGGNQLGTFTVTIERPAYLTWVASNVQVTKEGPCGNVIPVQLTARLQPETP